MISRNLKFSTQQERSKKFNAVYIAKISKTVALYLDCEGFNFFEKKYKGLTSELGYFCSKTAPMPRDEASVVICNSAFGSGSAKTGGFNMAFLISSNASCVSDVHSNGVSFLKRFVNGSARFAKF
ncbi:hypothetical protein TNCV_1186491 [Trichonephila clavipes]|nr:hypothetical protein TNCV_1186491 [Trichonephila clavipes]